jgi:PAS domain S-box-containing protein
VRESVVSAPHEPERHRRALERLAAGAPAGERDLDELRPGLAELVAENVRLREENRRLRDNEAHFRELFDATYDGIFVVDVERGRILEANAPACRLVGYARDELRALTIADLHPYDLPRVLDFAEEVRRHGRWQTRELTCRARSGEVIPAEMFATAVVYDGRPCILVLAHDLREHRLARLGLSVSKIGHDLRNILATTQLLADHLALLPAPEVQRVTPRLLDSIDRAIRLCTETLSHGRTGPPAPRRRTVALRPLVEDVAVTAGLGGRQGLAWRNDVPDELTLEADPGQLFRALLNLARNARQAIEEHESGGRGEIRVTATRRGERVVIEVIDTGPGLPPAARERLFEPFASVGREGGTGLGLMIARELIQGHGGELSLVESVPGGTTFRLDLPER